MSSYSHCRPPFGPSKGTRSIQRHGQCRSALVWSNPPIPISRQGTQKGLTKWCGWWQHEEYSGDRCGTLPNISTKDDGEQRVVLLGGTNNSPGDRSVSSSPLWWEEALQSVPLWRDQELLVQRKETPHVSSSESPERVWPPHALSFLWVTSSRPHSGEDESNES